MKQSTKRLASAFLGLLFFVGAFWVYLQLIRPAYAELNRLRGELVSRKQLAAEEQAVIGRVKDLIATYDSSAAAQEALAAAFPLQPNIAEAIGQLNGLLLTSALAPQAFVIDVADQNALTSATRAGRRSATSTLSVASVGTVSFKIRTAGTYGDIKRFLHDLETNTRIMDVTNVSLRPAQQVTQDLYVLEFTVVAYYQQEQE
jgi:Tfp pilus assembly protein PilO